MNFIRFQLCSRPDASFIGVSARQLRLHHADYWSTRLMAEQTGLTQNAIVRIWHAFGLQPHRVENFKFSKDPQFVEKVRDIGRLVRESAGSRHHLMRG